MPWRRYVRVLRLTGGISDTIPRLKMQHRYPWAAFGGLGLGGNSGTAMGIGSGGPSLGFAQRPVRQRMRRPSSFSYFFQEKYDWFGRGSYTGCLHDS